MHSISSACCSVYALATHTGGAQADSNSQKQKEGMGRGGRGGRRGGMQTVVEGTQDGAHVAVAEDAVEEVMAITRPDNVVRPEDTPVLYI